MPEQRAAEDRKQHLYLVFDDWNSGYSIRKLSLSRRSANRSKQSSNQEDSETPALSSDNHLPVFMRVRGLRGYPHFYTSAFGTKIMAMHRVPPDDIRGGVPTIDVQDQTITVEPLRNSPAFPIYIPASDDRLFHLVFGIFEVLLKPEPSEQWEWQPLPSPPFLVREIAYGVLPDGCVLVSTKRGITNGFTFIFDTKENAWKQYSNWVFPFTDHGHYDHSLEGFVGLSKDPDTIGYLHCCTIASTATSHTSKGPDLKCTKLKLYNNNPAEEKHVSATLVHMGQGKFCLVECICACKDKEERKVPPGTDRWDFMGGGPQGDCYMYRMKTFSLSYDRKGDLKLKNLKVHRYSLPHDARIGSVRMDPVAFWL